MRRAIGWILGGLLLVGAGLIAWLYFAGGSGEPSTELTTPTLAQESTTPPADAPETSAGAPTTTAPGEAVVFVIDPSQSVAAFEIDEVLRGEPTHVVGTTSELAGQLEIDPSDLATARLSQIVINARTFDTGSGNRDRAIRGPVILNSASDEFEFITFDVTSVDGLSGEAAVGDTLEFTVTGDLTIKATTNPTTFDVTATLVDEGTLQGVAETTVTRTDFDLGIPNAPGVADVTDEVVIRLEFVATAA